MNINKLNEELGKLLHEVSDETKKSYLDKRQAQLDKAQKNLEKAKKFVAKSDERQISNLPQRTSLENAKRALDALKSEMKKVSNGSNWRLEEQEDGEYISLQVRYWGTWEEHGEDDDWASLSDKYRKILDDILNKIQKQYNVKITEPGSEKKWLVFDIYLEDDSSEEITISDVDKFIEEYEEYEDFILGHPVELFYTVFGHFNFKRVYNNFKVGYSPSDDYGMTLYPNWDKKEPIFCLRWNDEGKLFIYQQFYKYKGYGDSRYGYLKQNNLIFAELDSKLFMPKTKQDLIKFIKIAKDECERILTYFDNNIIKNLETSLFNPKFKEWEIEPALDDEGNLVIRSNGPARIYIEHAIKKGADVFTVLVRTDVNNKEYYIDEQFNVVPTIQEIKDFAKSEISQIQDWQIPEIPKTLVKRLMTKKTR